MERISHPAAKTYLSQNKERLRKVAFFCTCEASSDRAFKQMQKLSGRTPLALLELKSEEVEKMRYSTKVAEFVRELSAN